MGGCNRFSTIYTVTGEGVSFGRVATTRRSCLEPQTTLAQTFISALDTTHGFDISDAGHLILRGDVGVVLTARR